MVAKLFWQFSVELVSYSVRKDILYPYTHYYCYINQISINYWEFFNCNN